VVLLLACLSNCPARRIFYHWFLVYWHAFVAMAKIQDLIKWLCCIYNYIYIQFVSLGWFFCWPVYQNASSWIFYDWFIVCWHALVAMAKIQDLIKWF
jgi:hypothetical protein